MITLDSAVRLYGMNPVDKMHAPEVLAQRMDAKILEAAKGDTDTLRDGPLRSDGKPAYRVGSKASLVGNQMTIEVADFDWVAPAVIERALEILKETHDRRWTISTTVEQMKGEGTVKITNPSTHWAIKLEGTVPERKAK